MIHATSLVKRFIFRTALWPLLKRNDFRNIITPLWLLTLRVSQIDREIKVSLEISRLDKHEDAREMNPSDTFMLHSNTAAAY